MSNAIELKLPLPIQSLVNSRRMPLLKSKTSWPFSSLVIGKEASSRRAGRSLVVTKPVVDSYMSSVSPNRSKVTIRPARPLLVGAPA